MNRFRMAVLAALSIGLAVISAGAASSASVYVGLGDSITFGETDLRYVGSYGDRGYVSKFADTLTSGNGGIRPTVANFAIDGETAASFMTGTGRTPPVMGRTDTLLAQQNLNYTSNPSTPQAAMFSSLVSSTQAAGNTITTVSITLGFNELAALSTLPTSQALSMLPNTLATYQTNYQQILSEIRTLAPTANLYLLGYYNPFPADPTANPATPIFAQGGPQLNSVIQGLASQYNATYVNANIPFLGNESALTYISTYPAGSTSPAPGSGIEPIGNVHPNDAGYTVIANQVASTPEPSSLGLVGAATLAFGAICTLRRRKASTITN